MTLSQAIVPPAAETISPVDVTPASASPSLPAQTELSRYLICSLPLIFAFPDNLRQFYKSEIPQARIIPVHGVSLD